MMLTANIDYREIKTQKKAKTFENFTEALGFIIFSPVAIAYKKFC
jgi:hypothetical protein